MAAVKLSLLNDRTKSTGEAACTSKDFVLTTRGRSIPQVANRCCCIQQLAFHVRKHLDCELKEVR